MATLSDALRVYKYTRSKGLLDGLNRVLKIYLANKSTFGSAVIDAIVMGAHQRWLRNNPKIDFPAFKSDVEAALSKLLPLERPETFEELYQAVKDKIGHITGVGDLTLYDIALRIGFLYERPLLPRARVYIQSGALDGIKALSADPRYSYLFSIHAGAWKNGAYSIEEFEDAFGSMESMFIEDFLCVFHNELSCLGIYTIKQLQ